jgi:diguanylate cyclase (GGDEF)-like protein
MLVFGPSFRYAPCGAADARGRRRRGAGFVPVYNVGFIVELTRHARSRMTLSLRKFPLRVLLWLPLPVVIAWAANRERLDYADARAQVHAEAREVGLSVGNVVALRVMRQFQELEFLAGAIRGAPDALDSRSRALLRASAERNPELFALNLQSGDGRRIVWSSASTTTRPVFKPEDFTPLPQRPDFLLGPIGYAPPFNADVLALRYRAVDAHGRPLYYIGSPYRAVDLAPARQLDAGWSVAIRDLRDGRVLLDGRAGARLPSAAQLACSVPIAGLPLSVEVGAPPRAIWARYARGLGLRLTWRVLVVLLTALGALAIGRLLQARERLLRRNTARARYNALLARVNQAMLGAHDVEELTAAVCRLAVREAPIRLAWIGHVDAAGEVELLAHAGAGGAPPIEAALAAAQARIERAWRDAQPAFAAHGVDAAGDGCAVLPLQRDGAVRALLGVHWSPQRRIGPDLQRALLDLARDVANGLARVELQRRLERLTLVDPLTDLPNRRALERHLEHTIRRAERLGAVVALGLIDLDDFKPVNDRYGHEIGDALLRQLGERLRALMRGSEMVARLGGDEFVLVIEDLDAQRALPQLGPVLERLHGAVRAPFDLGDGRSASVGLSMGLVLAPGDGREPDALLRLADATMYRVKHQKANRQSWWQLAGGVDDEPAEPPFDPFGSDARQLLVGIREVLDAVDALFIDTLYAELAQRAQTRAIIDVMQAPQREQLQDAQRAHLRFLLDPATSAAQIRQRAAGLGRLHALVGVTPSALVAAMQLFRELLGWHLDSGGRHARERYRLLRVVDSRVQMDLQDQLDAMVEVHSAYNAYAARPLPRPGQAWAEVVDAELGALAALAGIQGCVLQRPDAAGVLAVQASAGPQAAAIAAALSTPGLQSSLDPHSANGRGLSAQAWRTEAIASAPEYRGHAGLGPWHEIAARLGIRSAAAMPLLHGGQTDAVLALYGAYPNQFDTEQGRNFVAAVRNRWNMIDEQIHRRQPLVRQQDAEAYRQLLYADGLRMYVQPVVQLDDGRLRKVEALARLCTPDGRVVAPGQFLPALREADLDALFRMGLTQALQAQRAWREQGVDVDVSLNLPPSTLLHADCAGWVDEALRQHRVASSRLTLELLESQEIDAARRDAAIAALKALGVQLAIDDLGSGFSSLKRLASLPFDVIKVDQALVLDVERDPVKALSLIRTIIQIGRDFEKEVIAEGVENDAVIEAVTLLGADCGQGYGIARPMPVDAFVAWARSGALRVRSTPPLRTALGALAYHWLHMHDDPAHAGEPVDACPLDAFLQRRDDAAPALDWHRTVHDATDPVVRKAASAQLVAWLAKAAAR